MCSPRLALAALLGSTALASAAAPEARPVEFTRDIAPIFAEHCLACHGPEKQKSDYRLDDREIAMRGGESGEPAIIPGNSAASPLVQFVAGLDAELLMPPKKSDKKRLSTQQIGLLRAWIDQGAVWPDSATLKRVNPLDWWSLKPIARPEPPKPAGDDARWVRNPIDAFIVAKLRANGLTASPEAPSATLARRLAFDLTGLPPAPEDIEAFVHSANGSQESYERLVDKLLASPRHGERWARHWLDVVHFGETHGYDKDQPRPNAWPYRDYVIRAFNDDKPYARFVQEQIGGDALFPATRDGIEALGFIAAGPWDLIGHAELPESKIDGRIARHLDRDDMVSNTINTFCSLTVHCAQCHNHKFDPIPQEDYYGLQAVFAALDRADRTFDDDPAVARERARLEARRRELKAEHAKLETKARAAGGDTLRLLEKAVDEFKRGAMAEERVEFGWHSAISARQDATKWVQIDLGQSQAIEEIVLCGCHDEFNGIGAGFGFPVRFKVELCDGAEFRDGVTIAADQTGADFPNPGVTPWKIAPAGKTARFVRVTATRLAPRKDDFIFALGELEVRGANGRNFALGGKVASLDSIEAPPRWSRRNLTDGYHYGHAREPEPARRAAFERDYADALAKAGGGALFDEIKASNASIAAIETGIKKLPAPRTVYAGTVHHGSGNFAGTGANGGKPRPIFVLVRGDVTNPGKPAAPGALSAITARFEAAIDAPEGGRRAALARWLTDPQHPLVWRSIVNRVWQYHFGRGLVETPNDFGRMGQLPSHPELLDWLASEFRDNGGSLKRLHRLIVTSATYRQAVAANARADAMDSGNALLWRQNRRKLEAEAVRDSVLAVAGKLDLTMGGASFQDFVIEKPEHSPHYRYHLADPENPTLHRRSIYRFLVRSQQQPFMAALDCADPSMLVDRRNQTITPLQALAQLNNQLVLVMARHFAARVEKLGATVEEQIAAAFRLALSREPDTNEHAALAAYAREHGLANACRAILNLNEFAFID